MRVALIKPPHLGALTRGVGVYTKQLYNALTKLKANIHLVGLSYLPFSYSTFDIVQFPYFDPFFLTLPPLVGRKTVVTVHDLTPLIFPEGFPRGLRGDIKWQLQRLLLQKSDAIITVSQASKNDIVKIVGYPEEKVFVTYEAAASQFRVIPQVKRQRIILYVGDVNYNKNIKNLILAFNLLPPDYQLILVGSAFTNDHLPETLEIKAQVKRLNLEHRVVCLGYVKPEELVRFYNQAEVYVQPSIYEGFGLPVIEAMSCGTPVVCGNNSSLPEIGGDAAIYANIADPSDLANKIIKASKVPANKLISQAKKFTWEKTGKGTLSVYNYLCRD